MKLQQLSIFMENRTGRLAEVCRAVGDAGVNIRALAVADTSEFGILRLLVDKPDEAVAALSERGLTVRLTEVVAVEIIDRPGGLATILALLHGAGINIEYMYAFLQRHCENAILVFRFDAPEQAAAILREANVTVFTPEQIAQL